MEVIENLGLIAVLGAVNYWFINYFDIIDFFDRNQNDEKYSFWVVLGVINYSIIRLLLLTPLRHWNHYFIYVVSVFISFLVNYKTLKCISEFQLRSQKENKTKVSFRTVLVNTLEEFGECKKLCHIFDFEGNLIEHGWLEYYPSGDKESIVFGIQLDPPIEEQKEDIYDDFAHFRNNLSKNDKVRLLIDMENKVKIYIEFFD